MISWRCFLLTVSDGNGKELPVNGNLEGVKDTGVVKYLSNKTASCRLKAIKKYRRVHTYCCLQRPFQTWDEQWKLDNMHTSQVNLTQLFNKYSVNAVSFHGDCRNTLRTLKQRHE